MYTAIRLIEFTSPQTQPHAIHTLHLSDNQLVEH